MSLKDFANTIANTAENNPVIKFLFGAATNVSKDVGTGLASGETNKTNQVIDETNQMKQKLLQSMTPQTSPEEKQRILSLDKSSSQNLDNAQQINTPQYSEDINKNIVGRGLNTGLQIGTGADIAAHPIQTLKGIGQIVTHPIKTIQSTVSGIQDLLTNPIETIKNLPWDLENSFKLDTGDGGFTKLGNKVLAGQYKGAKSVVSRPADVVGNLADYGLTNPNEIENASKLITGKDGILPARINRGLKLTDPVDITGIATNPFGNAEMDTIFSNATAAKPNQIKQVKQFISNGLNSAQGSNLTGGANPEKTFQFIQDLGNQSYQFSSSQNLGEQQIGTALKQLKTTLENRLYNGVDATGKVIGNGLDAALKYTPFTDEEISSLEKISPKFAQVAKDAQGGANIRSLQQPFVQGNQMVNANEKINASGINLPEAVLAGSGHPALALSQTQGGKEAIGNALRGVGSLVGNPGTKSLPQLGIDAAGLITDKNQSNVQKNSSINSTIPSSAIDNSIPSNKSDQNFTIPNSINEIQPASNGSWSNAVPDQYHILGSNGQPVTMSADSYKTERAALNDAYNASKAKSDVINTPQNIADTASKKSALDNLDTNYSLGQKLDEPYKNAIKSTQSIDEAKRILASAPVDLLNSFKSIDQLASSTNADYSKLGKILQAISTNYPEAGVIFQPGQTKDVLAQSIDQAAKLVLNDYYGNFRAFTGNPTQSETTQPTQQTGLPSQITPTPQSNQPINNSGGWKPSGLTPMLGQL